MKFAIELKNLDKLPIYLKNQNQKTQKKHLLYVRCPMDIAPIYEDIYQEILHKTKDLNIDINIVFVVNSYNVDVKLLKALKAFSEQKNIGLFIEDEFEVINYYNDNDYITLDTAISAIEKLDKIVNVAKKNNFSPFEALLYAYLYVTKRPYVEEDMDECWGLSRSVFHVLTGNKIVCSGYCNVIRAFVDKYNDPNLLAFENSTLYKEEDSHELHSTLITYVKDNKYSINTYSYQDPTADAERENVKLVKNREFLLSGFMVPISDIAHLLSKPFDVEFPDLYSEDSFLTDKEYIEYMEGPGYNSFASNCIKFDDKFQKSLNDNINIIDYYSKKYQSLKSKYPSMIEQTKQDPEFLTEDLHKFSNPVSLNKIKSALYRVLEKTTNIPRKRLHAFIKRIIDDNIKTISDIYDSKAMNSFSKQKVEQDYEKQ